MHPDHRASRLLAGKGGLSRLEKEAMFDAIYERVDKSRSRRVASLSILSAVGIAAALLLVPKLGRMDATDEFASRGSGGPVGIGKPSFRAVCVESGGPVCAQGQRLLFQVANAGSKPYFSAFALGSEGRVLWYFPAVKEATSVPTTEAGAEGVLADGVVVGPEHTPGHYEIFGVFSAAPLGRHEIRQIVEADGNAPDVSITRQALEVK